MAAFVALLRAVNVGGTGKLPMTELKAMCEELGFGAVRTYIASGNVVFTSRKSESAIKAVLEKRLHAYAGAPIGVLVRSAAAIAEVLADNPFPKMAPNRTVAIFLDKAPPADVRRNSGSERRRGQAWPPRDLRALRRRHGDVKARDPRGQDRHRAQHEHHRHPGENGRGALAPLKPASAQQSPSRRARCRQASSRSRSRRTARRP